MEFFAGDAEVTMAYEAVGFTAAKYDIRFDNLGQDITSNAGFTHAIYLASIVVNGGALLSFCP